MNPAHGMREWCGNEAAPDSVQSIVIPRLFLIASLSFMAVLLLGIPALRLQGHFLAIVTIAFQTIGTLIVPACVR